MTLALNLRSATMLTHIPLTRPAVASSSRISLARSSDLGPLSLGSSRSITTAPRVGPNPKYLRTSLSRDTNPPLPLQSTIPLPALARHTPLIATLPRSFQVSPSSIRHYSSPSSAQASTQGKSETAAPSKTNPAAESAAEAETEADADEPPPNSSASARLKAMFKKYGWWALGMYLILGAVDCGLVFVAVHTLGAERISPLFDKALHYYRSTRYGGEEADRMKVEDVLRREKEALEAKENEGKGKKKEGWGPSKTVWAELALAYAIHKTVFLPVRAGLTVAWTPKFVGWLTRRGWVGKGGLTRAASHAQGKVRNASDRVKERVKRQQPDA